MHNFIYEYIYLQYLHNFTFARTKYIKLNKYIYWKLNLKINFNKKKKQN